MGGKGLVFQQQEELIKNLEEKINLNKNRSKTYTTYPYNTSSNYYNHKYDYSSPGFFYTNPFSLFYTMDNNNTYSDYTNTSFDSYSSGSSFDSDFGGGSCGGGGSSGDW